MPTVPGGRASEQPVDALLGAVQAPLGPSQGRVTELTINGNRADVRVLQDGLTRATGVTLVGNSALVLVELTKAVVVPYRRP